AVGAPVAVFEPDDVLRLRRRDLEQNRVLEGADAVHGARGEVEGPARRDDLDVERAARVADLELGAPGLDEDRLVLRAMELERELLARPDEDDLPAIAVSRSEDDLVAP